MIILLAACSLAVMLCLGFRDSFSQRYRQLGIDVMTANLQILPPESHKVGANSFDDNREGLFLLSYSPELREFLSGLPAVDAVLPVIETGAATFGLDGESVGEPSVLVGVDPQVFPRALPGANSAEGGDRLTWSGEPEIPVYRSVPDPVTEEPPKATEFERKNFRLQGAAWEDWKAQIVRDHGVLFGPGASIPAGGSVEDGWFLQAMTAALAHPDLRTVLTPAPGSDYSWRYDDARSALESLEKGADLSQPTDQILVARKVYVQAVFDSVVRPVVQGVTVGSSYTLLVPPARGDDLVAQPAVVPIKMVAYGHKMPFYPPFYYVDNAVLRHYLGILPDQCTSLLVRLKSSRDTAAVQAATTAWLKEHRVNAVVEDSEELGKFFLSTAFAFDIIISVILILLVSTVVVFVGNMVTLTLIKRRREIGTSIALGLSPQQNGWLVFGEMAALMMVAWAAAAVVGTGGELLLATVGLPGMIFFPDGRLHFVYSPWNAVWALGILLPAVMACAAFSLRKIGKVKVVNLLKEAS